MLSLKAGEVGTPCQGKGWMHSYQGYQSQCRVWKGEQDVHRIYPQATSPTWLEFMVTLSFTHSLQTAPLTDFGSHLQMLFLVHTDII